MSFSYIYYPLGYRRLESAVRQNAFALWLVDGKGRETEFSFDLQMGLAFLYFDYVHTVGCEYKYFDSHVGMCSLN